MSPVAGYWEAGTTGYLGAQLRQGPPPTQSPPSTSYSSHAHTRRRVRAAAGKGTVSERIGITREAQPGLPTPEQTPLANLREEAREDRRQVCDKIIAVFKAKPSSDWRKLIAFSKQWSSLSDSLFARLEQRIEHEKEQKERAALRRLNRKLKEVHEELTQHNATLDRFTQAQEADWDSMVASSREKLPTDFFSHVENLIRASYEDIPKRDELARVATKLLMLTEAFDTVAANQDAMQSAAAQFNQLLTEVTSLEDADKRIDELASSGKLDPALMLTMAKAYAAAKDTDYTKEEVKDVMAHLYFKAKESFAAMQPQSVRILKHLLWLESPLERREAMDQAFTPGGEVATATQDFLTTTPEELGSLIEAVLNAYDSGRNKTASGMQSETNSLMNPEVIDRMRLLQGELRKHYL